MTRLLLKVLERKQYVSCVNCGILYALNEIIEEDDALTMVFASKQKF